MGIGGEEISGLTCAQADWFKMGRSSVELLLKAASARGDAPPEHRLFPYEIRPGRTVKKI